MPNFDPNLINPVLTGNKLLKCWRKNITVKYLPKIGYLLATKNNLKFGMQSNFAVIWKKPQSYFLVPDPVYCQNWIRKTQIFYDFFLPLQYLICCFEAGVQLITKSYSHLSCSFNCNWFFCKSSICTYLLPIHPIHLYL